MNKEFTVKRFVMIVCLFLLGASVTAAQDAAICTGGATVTHLDGRMQVEVSASCPENLNRSVLTITDPVTGEVYLVTIQNVAAVTPTPGVNAAGINPFGDGTDPLRLDAGSPDPIPGVASLRIVTGTIFVRSEPGFSPEPNPDLNVIGKAPKDAHYEIICEAPNSWYQIRYNGSPGFVRGVGSKGTYSVVVNPDNLTIVDC